MFDSTVNYATQAGDMIALVQFLLNFHQFDLLMLQIWKSKVWSAVLCCCKIFEVLCVCVCHFFICSIYLCVTCDTLLQPPLTYWFSPTWKPCFPTVIYSSYKSLQCRKKTVLHTCIIQSPCCSSRLACVRQWQKWSGVEWSGMEWSVGLATSLPEGRCSVMAAEGPWHYLKGCSNRINCLLSLNFAVISSVDFGTCPVLSFGLFSMNVVNKGIRVLSHRSIMLG